MSLSRKTKIILAGLGSVVVTSAVVATAVVLAKKSNDNNKTKKELQKEIKELNDLTSQILSKVPNIMSSNDINKLQKFQNEIISAKQKAKQLLEKSKQIKDKKLEEQINKDFQSIDGKLIELKSKIQESIKSNVSVAKKDISDATNEVNSSLNENPLKLENLEKSKQSLEKSINKANELIKLAKELGFENEISDLNEIVLSSELKLTEISKKIKELEVIDDAKIAEIKAKLNKAIYDLTQLSNKAKTEENKVDSLEATLTLFKANIIESQKVLDEYNTNQSIKKISELKTLIEQLQSKINESNTLKNDLKTNLLLTKQEVEKEVSDVTTQANKAIEEANKAISDNQKLSEVKKLLEDAKKKVQEAILKAQTKDYAAQKTIVDNKLKELEPKISQITEKIEEKNTQDYLNNKDNFTSLNFEAPEILKDNLPSYFEKYNLDKIKISPNLPENYIFQIISSSPNDKEGILKIKFKIVNTKYHLETSFNLEKSITNFKIDDHANKYKLLFSFNHEKLIKESDIYEFANGNIDSNKVQKLFSLVISADSIYDYEKDPLEVMEIYDNKLNKDSTKLEFKYKPKPTIIGKDDNGYIYDNHDDQIKNIALDIVQFKNIIRAKNDFVIFLKLYKNRSLDTTNSNKEYDALFNKFKEVSIQTINTPTGISDETITSLFFSLLVMNLDPEYQQVFLKWFEGYVENVEHKNFETDIDIPLLNETIEYVKEINKFSIYFIDKNFGKWLKETKKYKGNY
ncbi:hypothetical protein DMC14_000120 [Metamycoplasma phocicerebrale]|uniref:Uncharacterized protein n=1 Tax=Metamycoplasma phocicerebrale TaxID=142649 RepID=A0A3T0TT00_9BACT|nr:hypothetical protein [Metamycoplasma phocicerebrale]AZZ65222.1 hypothetical protein DMC14_000120 [Metamycoplasma phocicerebrale]